MNKELLPGILHVTKLIAGSLLLLAILWSCSYVSNGLDNCIIAAKHSR